ncbi:MAG: hypothetical protein ABSF53_21975 [Terracidiphilus sp.]
MPISQKRDMGHPSAPGELRLFQFLIHEGSSAYNGPMRRAWMLLLMVVLAGSGVPPCMAARPCCKPDSQHSCCQPMARMQADCCGGSAGSSALPAEARREFAAPAGVLTRVTPAHLEAQSWTGVASVVQRTPSLHAPSIVLRT